MICLIFYAGIICDYDIALYRLKCYYNDVYRGITPNTNVADYNPEPPVFACRFCTTPGYEEILALANEDGKIAFQDTKIKNEHNLPLEGMQVVIYFYYYLISELLNTNVEILLENIFILQGTL